MIKTFNIIHLNHIYIHGDIKVYIKKKYHSVLATNIIWKSRFNFTILGPFLNQQRHTNINKLMSSSLDLLCLDSC